MPPNAHKPAGGHGLQTTRTQGAPPHYSSAPSRQLPSCCYSYRQAQPGLLLRRESCAAAGAQAAVRGGAMPRVTCAGCSVPVRNAPRPAPRVECAHPALGGSCQGGSQATPGLLCAMRECTLPPRTFNRCARSLTFVCQLQVRRPVCTPAVLMLRCIVAPSEYCTDLCNIQSEIPDLHLRDILDLSSHLR